MRVALLILLILVCFALISFRALHAFEPVWRIMLERRTLVHDGLSRNYWVYEPSRSHSGKRPLVIFLHGGSAQGRYMRYLLMGSFEAIADRNHMVVVYPDGVHQQWNDGRGDVTSKAHQEDIDDVGFLSEMIQDLVETDNVDPSRVYMGGISNGGMMAFRFACERADQVAAIGTVAASMPLDLSRSCAPDRPVPVVMMMGTHDPIVPYEGGFIMVGRESRGRVLSIEESALFWAVHNGYDPNTPPKTERIATRNPRDGIEKITYHGNGADVVLYRIEGGGHTWPGGMQYAPESLVGKTSRDIQASQVFWDFFQNHRRTDPGKA